jgi:putative ATP-binding cassette transporter
MKLWHFLRAQTSVSLPRIIGVAAISGMANAGLLAVVNRGAASVSNGVSLRLFLVFVTVITLYVVTQRYVLRVSSVEVEKIIGQLRTSLSAKIRKADLQSLESLGRSKVYASMNADTITISQAAAPMILACQGGILVLFSFLYILTLSPPAFFLTIVLVSVGISIHFRNRKQLVAEMDRSTAKEQEFFDGLTHLIDGFKEIKLNRLRSDGLLAHLRTVAGEVAEVKTKSGVRYADYYIFTQVLFYVLIGSMVFVLPELSLSFPGSGPIESGQVTRIVAAIMFIIGPLSLGVSLLPVIRAADHSVSNILKLATVLDRAAQTAQKHENGSGSPLASMETIEARELEFTYRDREGVPLFKLGPLDLTIRRGEVLLLVGGNGSGKSTLLKVLTALYRPDKGAILLNGVDVRTLGSQTHRELFSAIFSDYHLFDRLYGTPGVDPARVTELLKIMQIERKTVFKEGRFVNQELSTGQKKRLALVVALLEDKPIYIFDEWAADQDPEFRQFFYESLIPNLKEQGKTVICATHDDRYFEVGDRVVKMELGKIVSNSARRRRSQKRAV